MDTPTRRTQQPSTSPTQLPKLDHVATGVVLILGTNSQPFELNITNMHSGNLHGLLSVLHQSDRWPTPVRLVTPIRPVDSVGQDGGYNSRATNIPWSLNDFSRPWNKNDLQNITCKEEEPFTKPHEHDSSPRQTH
jgi:hypothetical protein